MRKIHAICRNLNANAAPTRGSDLESPITLAIAERDSIAIGDALNARCCGKEDDRIKAVMTQVADFKAGPGGTYFEVTLAERATTGNHALCEIKHFLTASEYLFDRQTGTTERAMFISAVHA